MKDSKKDAAEKLTYKLPQLLKKLERCQDVDPSDKEAVAELKALMALDHISPSDLLKHKRLFWKYLDFYQFDT